MRKDKLYFFKSTYALMHIDLCCERMISLFESASENDALFDLATQVKGYSITLAAYLSEALNAVQLVLPDQLSISPFRLKL